MEIRQNEEGGIVFLAISGRMDAATSPQAEEIVKKVLEGDTNRLLFDLSKLDYLSSAGLRVILAAAKEMKRRKGKFVLCSLNDYVKEIFEVSGFGAIIPIADSVESGVTMLSPGAA
jgi:anti-sigma B factor antagonist